MNFLTKVHYTVQGLDGKQKSYVEQFLHEAINYTEVETQLATLLEGRVKDYDHEINKINFSSVYEPHVKGFFYRVTLEEKTIDGKGKEKVTTLTHFVVAQSPSDAEKRTAERIKNWITDTTIVAAAKSKILAYWHPISEDWQNDYKSRMADYASAGHENADPNQLNLFGNEDTTDTAEPSGPAIKTGKKGKKDKKGAGVSTSETTTATGTDTTDETANVENSQGLATDLSVTSAVQSEGATTNTENESTELDKASGTVEGTNENSFFPTGESLDDNDGYKDLGQTAGKSWHQAIVDSKKPDAVVPGKVDLQTKKRTGKLANLKQNKPKADKAPTFDEALN